MTVGLDGELAADGFEVLEHISAHVRCSAVAAADGAGVHLEDLAGLYQLFHCGVGCILVLLALYVVEVFLFVVLGKQVEVAHDVGLGNVGDTGNVVVVSLNGGKTAAAMLAQQVVALKSVVNIETVDNMAGSHDILVRLKVLGTVKVVLQTAVYIHDALVLLLESVHLLDEFRLLLLGGSPELALNGGVESNTQRSKTVLQRGLYHFFGGVCTVVIGGVAVKILFYHF